MAHLKSIRELDVIRGKLEADGASVAEFESFIDYTTRLEDLLDRIRDTVANGTAAPEEVELFLAYVSKVESVLDEADQMDYFGTEGWKHYIGVED